MRSLLALLAACLLSAGCSDSSPASSSGAPRGDAGPCTTDADCVVCCNTANEAANEIAVGYVIRECACKDAETACSAQCKAAGNDICNEPGAAPSDACIACIDGELQNSASSCVQAAETTCTGDEACAPLLYCLRGCP
jgi:hypothetical protein